LFLERGYVLRRTYGSAHHQRQNHA
jgi:hypothetical protein